MVEDYSYLGVGIVLICEWNIVDLFLEIGNILVYIVVLQINIIELVDYQNFGGGMVNCVDCVIGYNFNYMFYDFNLENFVWVICGKVSSIVVGIVIDELVLVVLGSFVLLLCLVMEVIVVKLVIGIIVYEVGKDYCFECGMLFILVGFVIVVLFVVGILNIKVIYKNVDLGYVEVVVILQKFYEMQFYGVNEVCGGKLVCLVVYKVVGGVIESMGLIGNEFGVGSVFGVLFKDLLKVMGNDKLVYFYWQQEK